MLPFLLQFLLLFFIFLHPFHLLKSSAQQLQQPQNLQARYPFPLSPPPLSPNVPPPIPPSPSPAVFVPAPPPTVSSNGSSSKKSVGTAIGVTAACTLVISGLLFFLFYRYSRRRRRRETSVVNPFATNTQSVSSMMSPDQFVRVNGGNLKGVIFDENGLDVLYWRKLQSQDSKRMGFEKKSLKKSRNFEEDKMEEKQIISEGDHHHHQFRASKKPIHESPLLRGKSSTSQSPIWSDVDKSFEKEKPDEIQLSRLSASTSSFKALEKRSSSRKLENLAPPSAPPRMPPPPPPPPPFISNAVSKGSPPELPLVSSAISEGPAPPPPPPPPQPSIFSKGPAPPPPPPPKASTALSSTERPPPVPKGMQSGSQQGQISADTEGQVKLKPLHWDKVNPNVEHSMVWDKMEGGSFKFDDDLMEALFGYVATKRKSPRGENEGSTSKVDKSGPPSQIFILDIRKSQNIAIVLKSLGLSYNNIIDALIQGDGLDTDILEKMSKIAPTKEEESAILEFDGDPTRLADAESFLYHLLKAVPSAFNRFNALLFKSTYSLEMIHLKESFQTLEHGCKELRARGLLLKLLEAILKAGNRMNAGTSRGNAQAFNLTALKKLSDVKSTDGKTTLLHFVVEEVVRAEGKRCVINRNRNLSRSNSQNSFVAAAAASGGGTTPESSLSREEREKEYIKLGLPIVGGLSSEFTSVKKAATFDYDGLEKSSTSLSNQIAEVRKIVGRSDDNNEGFSKKMITFLNAAERETRILKEEQNRVMDIVRRTTEYYQSGTSKDKNWQPLQIFAIIKDFLRMVDHACVDITRNLQKRKPLSINNNGGSSSSSSPPGSPQTRPSVRFPKLPANFMSGNNDSDDDHDDDS